MPGSTDIFRMIAAGFAFEQSGVSDLYRLQGFLNTERGQDGSSI